LVDYAHTPDALRKALATVRAVTTARVICVFGCGGDRDADKRAPMGEAAAAGADLAILTNDNPRSEDPRAIAAAVEQGLGAAHYQVELDRGRAIEVAIRSAGSADSVLIAGKGHEDYQIIGDQRLDFDDRVVARAILGHIGGDA
jgi:UDP-N-acetylmuramoyl-L-alanyl-D-glutamate--2,6-diaminopimelate ligase